MTSIIKNTTSNDLETLSREDFKLAFIELKKENPKINELSDEVRKIIIGIIELSRKFKLDIKDKDLNLQKSLITKLEESGDLFLYWLSTKIKEIMFPLLNNSNYDQKSWLPNRNKFEHDIEDNVEKNKMIVIIKILNFDRINNLYGCKLWNEILGIIIEKLKNDLVKEWFKLYRFSWTVFWLLNNNEYNTIEKTMFLAFLDKYTYNFYVKNKKWEVYDFKIKIWISMNQDAELEDAILASYNPEPKITIFRKNKKNDILNREEYKRKQKKLVFSALNESDKTAKVVMFYQKIQRNIYEKDIDDKGGKYESLVRIIKENGEIILPWDFLPFIEWDDLMDLLTKKTIELVTDDMMNKKDSFSINLDWKSLNNKEIINHIEEQVKDKWIDPSKLIIEILENEMPDNDSFKIIENLKKMWFRIAIDDFWTWYSNFGVIMKIKPDYIKIDWSLIKRIADDKTNREVVRCIVKLAHFFWAEVIAEFVKNNEIQQILEEMGVQYSQWNYISEPKKEKVVKVWELEKVAI